jgi:hypothetical protein
MRNKLNYTRLFFKISEGVPILKTGVYNILGQEVATLLNGEILSGNHSIQFDASKLASGVYVYRFSGNNVNISKKMLLQK